MRRKTASKNEVDDTKDGSDTVYAKGLSNKSKTELIGLIQSLTEDNFDLKNKLTERNLYTSICSRWAPCWKGRRSRF